MSEAAPAQGIGFHGDTGDRTLTVQWDGVPEARSYNLYWSERSGVDKSAECKISDVRGPYSVRDLENEKTYHFVVTAVNDFGESEASGEVSVRPSSKVVPPAPRPGIKEKVHLKFKVPKGKVAGVMGVMNYLQSKFKRLDIELTAEGGEITLQEYDDKIREAFRQLGVEVEE